jgi:hypothetical protein
MSSFVSQIVIALGAASLLLGVLGYTMSPLRLDGKPRHRNSR